VIEDKLKKARLRTAKSRMQLGIGLLVTICLCALLVAGLSFFDFSPKNLPVADLSKQIPAENDTEKIRGKLIEGLKKYENELEPRLEAANLQGWNPEGLVDIIALKKELMSTFGNGEYGTAMDHLLLLENLTLEMVNQADQIFEENLEKATSLLAEEHYDGAKIHIETALSVHPQSPAALALEQEIEKLPPTLILLNGARAARAENNLEKEYDFLQQVLGVAPEREGVKERLGVLAGLIQSRNFDRQISSGFAGIENRQAKKARTHYREAKKIDPQRPELSMLMAQLLDLEKSLRVEQAVSLAEQAIRQDDWPKARLYFARAAKDAPENKTVAEGLQRADHFIELLASLDRYLKNPYRLSNPDVRKRANETLVQAETASGYSFAIKTQARQLSELMTRVNRSVIVTVISDNKTYVLVRSVGKVGVVFQKNIELKPGNYTFEGARKGFKSKLVQAFIPYDQDSFSVRVICDELI
jgi:tetratricopeptide (TPR) repeat protein